MPLPSMLVKKTVKSVAAGYNLRFQQRQASSSVNRDQILQEADRCVKCGICLPHCPTYNMTRDEGDSPRGRIALIQALVAGKVTSQRLHDHLDRCLTCVACEPACPSGVKYGKLIDATRALTHKHPGFFEKLQRSLITQQTYKGWSRPLLRIYQSSGARRIIRTVGSKKIRRLDALLPEIEESTPWNYPATDIHNTPQRRIALFTGCIARITEHSAIGAAIRVMRRLKIEVIIPSNQGCCGAMHAHTGAPATADTLAEVNVAAFNALNVDATLYLASGCGAQLASYGDDGHNLTAPVMEVSQYILNLPEFDSLLLRPLAKRVALHTPCSLKNVLKGEEAPALLLRRIPGLVLVPLPDSGCCGAAGSYLLDQPEMSDRLRDMTLNQLIETKPDILATSNTGCALHLGSGIRQAHLPIEVVHPVQLIERQSRDDGIQETSDQTGEQSC